MKQVYLSLGTNLGDKPNNLLMAIIEITRKIGKLSAVSSVYKTKPDGFESENDFLNMVVLVETELLPIELLSVTQQIENTLGRTEKSIHSYKDRFIDIDIIAYENLILKSDNLQLPHPLFHRRRFVMEPLNEIAPDYVHPVLKKSIGELLK